MADEPLAESEQLPANEAQTHKSLRVIQQLAKSSQHKQYRLPTVSTFPKDISAKVSN
jgi:hypothetical protein